MNVLTRGIRGAVRSPLKTGAIVIMLAMSIGLIVAMLAAKAGVATKINQVKSQAATGITIRPAGIMGFGGGGNPLTADQVAKVQKTPHIAKTVTTLTDQLGTSDTSLSPSLNLGSFGTRQQRFENQSDSKRSLPAGIPEFPRITPASRTTVTGTTDSSSVAANGRKLTITSGKDINGTSNNYEALVGASLAIKNKLVVGGTFSAYTKTFTVTGIFKTGNAFEDSGLIIPLATLQLITDQIGAVTSITATVDSSDNISSVVDSLKSSLGTAADITSDQQRAEQSVASLAGISNLATTGVIGATIAAAVIVLLTMTMIVRERKREIGVIKAIGGTNASVIIQFMTEALTLTIIGGLIGIGIGIAVSGTITQGLVDAQTNSTQQQVGPPGSFGRFRNTAQRGLQAITSTVTPETIAAGAGLTLFIAIIGSAVPAWLIARIRPAEVLRGE